MVYDEKGRGLYNVKIQLQSRDGYAYSAYTGAFIIPHAYLQDSIILSADGYETIRSIVTANRLNIFYLKVLSVSEAKYKRKLLSFVKDSLHQNTYAYHANESYTNIAENEFLEAAKYPETGFSLNIDCASYSNIRRFLNNEMKVPANAVRIEEMLNYFNLKMIDREVNCDSFCFKSHISNSPWSKNNNLLFLSLQAPSLKLDSIPPCNLVFLIDVSGSMDQSKKLPLLQSAFKLLVKNLREQDTVAIVIYGGTTNVLLQPTSGREKNIINEAIDKLNAGGETPGEAAIKMAYRLAQNIYNKDANNRVILATDGDFNVGLTTDKELEDVIAHYRNSGIYLTCLGVGMGNYKDSKLESLSKKGNGNFAYIDNIKEAERVLIHEFTKTLYAVANDAYVTVVFNANKVNKYRLIGFDNRLDNLDADSTELEGGEVGSGHALTAVFEFTPELKDADIKGRIAAITCNYKLPGSDTLIRKNYNVEYSYKELLASDSCIRFSVAVIMFGELLKQSKLVNGYVWNDIINLAKTCVDTHNVLQLEFLTLVEKAKKIYAGGKKNRRRVSL